MLKIFFPPKMEHYAPYVSAAAEKDLIMVAEEEGVVKGICGFYYKGSKAVIHQLSVVSQHVDLPVMDGLFRTVMFHLREMECHEVKIEEYPIFMKPYFTSLGFEEQCSGFYSDHFETLLFSGCSGCKAMSE